MKKTAFMGIMLAVIMVLSVLEHMLPPIPLMPPNVKLGLSNIITMYCVFFIGKSHAVMLSVIKSAFVFLIRGPMSGFLSLSGGLLSICVIVMLVYFFKDRLSFITISIFGAISHNIGQITTFSLIMKTNLIFYYFPILLVSGIIMGIVTGTLLNVLLPVMHKVLR